MEQFLSVEIDKIIQSSTNPRKHFDEKQLEDLRESIRAKGIINPLLVRPFKNGCYEIVAGERRWRASKALKLAAVPVIVRDLTNEQALEIQVIENLQRADVHPLDEAEGYAQLMKKNKYDQQKIAEKVGKSVVYVYQRLQLASLIDGVKKMFFDEQITVTHAIHIARLSAENQKVIAQYIKQQIQWRDVAPPVKVLDDYIAREVFLDLSKAPFDTNDATLQTGLPPCSSCQKHTGCNQSLFSDIGKKDMCQDKACFQKKTQLHIERTIQTAEESGEEIVKVSSRYRPSQTGMIGCSDYEIVSSKQAKKPDIKRAIVVEGDDIGKTVYVKTKKRSEDDYTGAQKLQRAIERAAKTKREMEMASRKRLLDSIIDKVNTTLSVEDLKLICETMFEAIGSDNRKRMNLEACGIDRSSIKKEDLSYGYHIREHLPSNEYQLNKMLVQMALVGSIYINEYVTHPKKTLLETAERYKIDEKKIYADVKAEFEAKKKPAAKNGKPAAKKKPATVKKSKKSAGKVKK